MTFDQATPPDHPESAFSKEIQQNRQKFGKTFKEQLGPWITEKQNDPVRIMSVGCGLGLEMKVLDDLFPQASVLIGIDIDDVSIDAARALFASEGTDSRIQFKTADACTDGAWEHEKNSQYDLILIRSPNLLTWNNNRDPILSPNWRIIFQYAYRNLSPNGILYITVGSSFGTDNLNTDESNAIKGFFDEMEIAYQEEENRNPQQKNYAEQIIFIAKKDS